MQNTVIPNQQRSEWQGKLWKAIVKLDFISKFFAWLNKGLAIIAEPFATFSAIYIIIAAGVPQLLNENLHATALAIILGAPELLVIGAFRIASDEIAGGNKKGWLLIGSCVTLLILTALTVCDLFIWHWDQNAVNILMGIRCLAGISYSFTRGIVAGESSVAQTVIPDPLQIFAQGLLQQVQSANQASIAEVQSLKRELQSVKSELQSVNRATFTELQSVKSEMQNELRHFAQGLHSELQHFTEGHSSEGRGFSDQRALETVKMELNTLVESALERLQRDHSQRLKAVLERVERVSVTLEQSGEIKAIRPAQQRVIPARPQSQAEDVHQSNAQPDAQQAGSGLLKRERVRQYIQNYYISNHAMPLQSLVANEVGASPGTVSPVWNEVDAIKHTLLK